MNRTVLLAAVVLLIVGPIAGPTAVASDVGTLAHAGHECTFPIELVDATGETVTLATSPERIVTTGPSAAQTVWELDAADRVVGLTAFADYLDGADERTVISGEEEPIVLERVVDLDPDLILAPNTTQEATVSQLREAGLTVYHFHREEDMDDVIETVTRIGELIGECERAEETTDWMAERMSLVEEVVADRERPTVLYLFFDFTAGSNTFVDAIIEAAGGENVAAAAGIEGYQVINEEVVVDADPDWVLLNADDPALPDSPALNETTAVKEGQVVVLPIEQLNQPAPRTVLAIETLAAQLHPEAYEAVVEDSDDASAASTGDGTLGDDATPLPGFGFVGAIAALVGVLVGLSRRR